MSTVVLVAGILSILYILSWFASHLNHAAKGDTHVRHWERRAGFLGWRWWTR